MKLSLKEVSQNLALASVALSGCLYWDFEQVSEEATASTGSGSKPKSPRLDSAKAR